MKRKTFVITRDGAEIGRRYAFNTAVKEIECDVRARLEIGGKADLVDKTIVKDGWGNARYGTRVWQIAGGQTVTYEICLSAA